MKLTIYNSGTEFQAPGMEQSSGREKNVTSLYNDVLCIIAVKKGRVFFLTVPALLLFFW